jgi:hypothetical protein
LHDTKNTDKKKKTKRPTKTEMKKKKREGGEKVGNQKRQASSYQGLAASR